MSQGQKNFVKGAAILGIAGLIVKVIGAIFRIPLTNIIGPDGMASYQAAYPVYALLVVVSTAGFPAAISKLVSERVALGDFRGAHRVFQKAFKMLLLFGFVSTVLVILLAGPLSAAIGITGSDRSLRMIAPSLLFVSVLSAYRGYFQGLQRMSPTAITQLVEQVIKLGAGLTLAYMMYRSGGPDAGAAGALLGVSISEFVALVTIILIYNRKKKSIKATRRRSGSSDVSERSLTGSILRIVLPVTLGACVMPFVSLLDTLIVTNVMSTVNYSAFNPLDAETSFGLLTGAGNTLINMPAVFSIALCMSLVPAISEARAERDLHAVSIRSATGFKLAILIGLPCALGLYLLAGPIIQLLYGSFTADELTVAAQILQNLSIGVFFLTLVQTLTGILQGSGRPTLPLIALLAGCVVKIVLSFVLIPMPSLNINGAAISTAACYGVAAMLDLIFVIKIARPHIRPITGILMPLLSTAVMGVLVYYMYPSLLPELGNTKSTILCIAGAILVYLLMLFITGALKKDDMEFIPGGGRVVRFMNRLGFWED